MTDGQHSADRVALAGVFVELAATLTTPYLVTDLAQRLVDGCVELLEVWACGLLLADPGSTPKILAASAHQAGLLELVQVQSGQGPCLAAMDSNDLVVVTDLDTVADAWPEWVAGARELGIRGAYGIPLRADGRTVGALNLFVTRLEPLPPEEVAIARALADVATVGILAHRAMDEAVNVNGQLQRALDSRVVIEQAKGVVAVRDGVSVAEAFLRLRQQARSTSQPLSTVAQAVVDAASPAP